MYITHIALATAGLSAIGMAVGLAQGTGSTGSAPAVVPTFQVDAAWPPTLPNGWLMGVPSWVTVDRRDHVWVLHRPRTLPPADLPRAAPPVLELDARGALVGAWGGPSDRYDWPDIEHGIFVDHRDHVWIGGINPIAGAPGSQRSDDMLLEFTRTGQWVRQIGGRDTSRGNRDTHSPKRPADVFVHPQAGEILVADGYGNTRVLVLDLRTGAFKRMWGAFGRTPVDAPPLQPGERRRFPPLVRDGPGPDQFDVVHALTVSRDGLVYVADRQHRRIQVFTLAGRYLTQVFINRQTNSPRTGGGFAFSPDREQRFLYVADFDNGQVVILDRRALQVVGSFGNRGARAGDFQSLHNLASDSTGNLYTAEVAPGARVQKFQFRGLSSREAPK